MCSDNCRLLSLRILQELMTSPVVMGADPGAAPLTLISHNGQDTGQLFNKNARFWGRHGWCVRRGFGKHEWITRMINNSSHHSTPWEITRRMLERESGADVGVPAPQLQSTMSCAPCVTVVHSYALPLHRGLGKIHAVTLRRRAVARLNRLVCNLTPGRAFAIALPTESLFKKERDESNAPDSVTPLQKRTQLSLRLRVPRFGSA